MIQDETLEELMTSDFDEDLKPDEWRSLFKRFRNYYRILYGNFRLKCGDVEKFERELDELKKATQKSNTELKSRIAQLKDENHQLKQSRKLSWKERIKGETISMETSPNDI